MRGTIRGPNKSGKLCKLFKKIKSSQEPAIEMLQYLLCSIIGIFRFLQMSSGLSSLKWAEIKENNKTNGANGNIILICIFKLAQMKTLFVLWCLYIWGPKFIYAAKEIPRISILRNIDGTTCTCNCIWQEVSLWNVDSTFYKLMPQVIGGSMVELITISI